MRRYQFAIAFIMISLLLLGCVPQRLTPTPVGPIGQGPESTQTEVPAAVQSVQQMLAQQLQIPREDIQIVSVEAVEWPDACLGVSAPGQMCAQVVTPGYKLIMRADGKEYVYHTNLDGSQMVLAIAPEPLLGDLVLEWEMEDGAGCNRLLIGTEGLALGACRGSVLEGQFVSPGRAEQLDDYVQTFVPFEASTPVGEVSFKGQGSTEATPAEQRMIAEWSRLVFSEAQSGRSGASWGLAFAWHREGGIAGFCDDLAVYLTGDVYATSCRGEQAQDLGHMRLNAEQLDRLYGYVDRLGSFEMEQADEAVADAMNVRVVFAGTGSQEATEADKQAMQDWAAELFATLAVK